MATSKDERRTALMSLAARRHNRPYLLRQLPQCRSADVASRWRTVAPGVEDVLDTSSHLCARRFALGAGHEKVVVVGVDMPDGGRDGESDPRAYPGRLPSRSKRFPTARGTPPARRPNPTPDIEVTSPARVGRFPPAARRCWRGGALLGGDDLSCSRSARLDG